MAIDLADDAGVVGVAALVPLAKGGVATVALFGVGGLGLTRLLLPEGLRRHEGLWVLPVGACAVGLEMTVLGFLGVPFMANVVVIVLVGTVLAGLALQRRPVTRAGLVGGAGETSLALWLGLVVCAIALIPLFRAGFATVGGQGQDAHLAVGSGMFLQHAYPTGTDLGLPVDQMPLVWRSKYPIYYALGAASTLAGLEVFQTLSTMAGVLLGLAGLGFFVFARDVLGAPRWAALLALAVVGLDRMVLHTVMHPYFNQTWGFMAMPFAFVLSWWVVRERTRGGLALLALFLLVLAFAYPLALPIPLIPVAIALWPQRRRVREVRKLWRGRRSLVWLLPALLVLSIPLRGVLEKGLSAWNVLLNPRRDLRAWGGDLSDYYPEPWFLGVQEWWLLGVLALPMGWGIWLALRDKPRMLRDGLLGVLAFAVLATVYFRLREFGYYFHFKTLAFVAPFAVAIALAGFARFKRPRLGVAAAVLLLFCAIDAAGKEIGQTFDQLPRFTLQLREIDAALPPGRSVRLDVDPQEQNWTAFWLHGQPLCSQVPLLGTSYPHVPVARKADFILTRRKAPRPADAADGPPAMEIEEYRLWKQRPGIPQGGRCSQRMVQTIGEITA